MLSNKPALHRACVQAPFSDLPHFSFKFVHTSEFALLLAVTTGERAPISKLFQTAERKESLAWWNPSICSADSASTTGY
jgi:hypothetical protein